ncbi:M64 family metallopeptidase [Perlabentimonas gracilis]|uniref:M64 family metallopeptidase n=1 Tax=Perlabentimonas gracilis TaxID=2715279 RepID=UPI0014092B95|nr:M64 family metallopeptidase [Perlabentimonas gracilis]NHB69298.1 peptidase [Perlabentimonas gracilis]
MKSFRYKVVALLTLVVFFHNASQSQIAFDSWFENKALRIDYFLAGNETVQQFFLKDLSIEPHWSGSHTQTLSNLDLGSYKVEVTDKDSNTLLYTYGFCTLFQEWQTVNEATYQSKAFEQVTRIPFPKKTVDVTFFARDKQTGKFQKLYNLEVNPNDISIIKNQWAKHPVTKIIDNGNANQNLDITFIAEGYTYNEMDKFRSDVKKLADYLFAQEPFAAYKNDINIWAVESPSEVSGPTNPRANIWNRTAVSSSFNTFGIDRYLTSTSTFKIMDIAANAPSDVVYILVNTADYGGGGIYNHYNVATSDNPLSSIVFIHELGHGLAGLGDEYYTSDVAYENFYPLDVEPWEQNITTRVNFDAKWADMLKPSTPIPTPQTKDFQKTVGVYEGGGYMSKGVYRPYIDCRMKSNEAKGFCPVCQRAIRQVLESYR